MDFPRDPPKLKSLTSLFFGKKEKRQSMQGPPPPTLEPGLKTLTTTLVANHNRSLSCKKPNILYFSSTASSSSSSSSSSLSSLASPPSTSPSTSSLMDDVKDHAEEEEAVACHAGNANADGNHDERKEEEEEEEKEEEEEAPQMQPSFMRRRQQSSQKEREFPPPIPHLARTGNLPCHMPWVLKRSYIDNGRLVIQEVKVKHHEYFRAHRANGRLTLQIMQLDDSATSLPWRSPASPTVLPEITDKTDENSPSSSSSSSASASSSPSPSAAEDEDECSNTVKNNAPVERSNIPPQMLSPSSLPPPPSMLSKELKNIIDVNRGCSCQGSCSSINRDDTIGGTRDVMEMGTLPSILSSSMPESSFGIGGGGSSGGGGGGGGGGCCCLNKRSTSLFSTPIPTIRPVHS